MASGKGRNPQGFRGRLIGKITPRGKEGGVWEGSEDNMNKNINVPNALSVLRLLVIAPFVYFYLNDQIVPAVTMLVISGLSDMFDGMIARRFNQITPLGQMLDPLADKLTQGAVAICMAIRYPILIPVLIIFVVKEFSMIVAACVLLKKKKNPGPSKWYGKAATVMFYIHPYRGAGDPADAEQHPCNSAACAHRGDDAVCPAPVFSGIPAGAPVGRSEGQDQSGAEGKTGKERIIF